MVTAGLNSREENSHVNNFFLSFGEHQHNHQHSTFFNLSLIYTLVDMFSRNSPNFYRHPDMRPGIKLAFLFKEWSAARINVRRHGFAGKNRVDAPILETPKPVRSTDLLAIHKVMGRRGHGMMTKAVFDGKAPSTPKNDSIIFKADGNGSVVTNGTTESDRPKGEIHIKGLHEDDETPEQFKARFTDAIQKMMFVSGETAEPSQETTTLIEEIVRQQVIEMLTRSTALAARRGVRSISTDDLIFLIRHDKAKVSRLKTFLSWKDVRKNVKDSDDKGGADAADFGAGDDPLAGAVVAGPSDVAAKPKNKRAKVGLPWDVNSFYSVQVPEREDEEDEDEEEQNYATLQRLANADERTKHMTKEEYVFWSDCRQASFTFRKGKRFREWAGFGIVTDSRPNDDIVDILGFLTFEIVQTLTEGALKVKEQADRGKKGRETTAGENGKKRKREPGLFDPPAEGRTPIEPRHIHEAYRKLQATPNKAVAMLLHGGRAPIRTSLRLI